MMDPEGGSSNFCNGGRSKIRRKDFFDLLPRHQKCTPDLLAKLAKLPDEILENRASELAAKGYRMSRQVSREYDKTRSFTRTQLNDYGILFGTMQLRHRVEDLVLKFFHKRFPQYMIALFDKTSQKTFICDENGNITTVNQHLIETVDRLSKGRSKISFPANIVESPSAISKSNQEIFNTFYESQYIPERDNPRYFRQMIPKRWLNAPGMEMEKGFRNEKLDQFLEGESSSRKKKKSPLPPPSDKK